MRKTEQVEYLICDVCETRHAYDSNSCVRCQKAFCLECEALHARAYHIGVYSGGNGDANYCLACDALLRQRNDDPMHQAYLAIDSLRAEERGFYVSFKARADQAEATARRLYDARKATAR